MDRWDSDITPAQDLVQIKRTKLKHLLILYAGIGVGIGALVGLHITNGIC